MSGSSPRKIWKKNLNINLNITDLKLIILRFNLVLLNMIALKTVFSNDFSLC